MNANTETEARALEVAIRSQHLMLVPLSELHLSKRNVRKTAAVSVAALAASIQRVGLLQNLTVIPTEDGEHYEVVAGGRRLAALKLLAMSKRIVRDYEVPCLLVSDAAARTTCVSENVQREAMHPADQFEAFSALVAEGRPIEDIAADFCVTPLVVERRLKLANVSPRLMADYRADAVTLDQLMALAITDDHAAQDAAFFDAPQWQRHPAALRDRLTARQIDALHPMVRFVGLEAYTAAGGSIKRDLFSDDDHGVYLDDAALLERLVRDKLSPIADTVRPEGWGWVEVVPHLSAADRNLFHAALWQKREPTATEARRLASLQSELDKVDAALEAAYEGGAEGKTDALHHRREQVSRQLQAVHDDLQEYAADVRAVAGAIVTTDHSGNAIVHRGFMREADSRAVRALEKLRRADTGERPTEDGDEGDPRVPGLSDRLAQRLSVHRTAALQIELARHPHIMLAALVHTMVQTTLQGGYVNDLPIGVRATSREGLEVLAPDWPNSGAETALRELKKAWSARLPEDSSELFASLCAMSQGELVQLLAVCGAATVDVVTPRASADVLGTGLAAAVQLDMAKWWQPTAESYFQHVSKAAILAAVQAFAPAHAARLAMLKKAELATEAERLVEGAQWMPAVFATTPEGASATTTPTA